MSTENNTQVLHYFPHKEPVAPKARSITTTPMTDRRYERFNHQVEFLGQVLCGTTNRAEALVEIIDHFYQQQLAARGVPERKVA